LASVTAAQFGDGRCRRDPLARQQQPERHLHDTAATGAACVDVREAVLSSSAMVRMSMAILASVRPTGGVGHMSEALMRAMDHLA
jgi:hypothetical protein